MVERDLTGEKEEKEGEKDRKVEKNKQHVVRVKSKRKNNQEGKESERGRNEEEGKEEKVWEEK